MWLHMLRGLLECLPVSICSLCGVLLLVMIEALKMVRFKARLVVHSQK